MTSRLKPLLVLAATAAALHPIAAQVRLSGTDLVDALRRGGYVLVMRHARSPRETPDAGTARPDNVTRERQLDEAGRSSAQAMGDALRRLKIPIGDVLSSPTYRALETVRMARLGEPKSHAELGDRGQSMKGVTEVEGAWLRSRASEMPAAGNTVIVTHMPNITRAFGTALADVADGETLVFRGASGKPELVGRIKIEEWPGLVAR